MIIQINRGENIETNERSAEYFSEAIVKDLDRFSEYLTRVEVHFSDINAEKGGPQDKKCVIEARVKNREPLAVTAQEDAMEKAFNSALGKVKASMTTIVGKMRNR